MPTKLKGRATPAAVAGKNGHSLISSKKFRQMYAALLQCELLEERLGGFSVNGTPSAIAAAVGLTLDLEREDTVVLSPGTLAASFVKGVPASALLNHGNAAANGAAFSFGEVNAYKPGSSAAGVHAGFATGAALANKMAKNGRIAVAFMGGGAATLAECREALELASKYKLPVLYVAHVELNRKDEKLLAKLAELFPVITVDAHDVVAIYRVAQESIARARDGGPTLIVCVPLTTERVPANAVANMERYLAGKKLFESRWKDEALAQIGSELGRGLSSSV
jgi:TPP-dependent pyruvate/acetoin dehydrogenase alpha subunit